VKNIIGEDDEDETLAARAEGQKGGDYKTSLEYEILTARGVELSESDIAILCVIGDGKTIREITDAARKGHFDSLEAIKRLLSQRIIKPAKKKEAAKAAGSDGKTVQYVALAVLLAVVLGGIGMKIVAWPQIVERQVSGMEDVRKLQAVSGLKSIEKSLKIYVKLHGEVPNPIHKLAAVGVVPPASLVDPWKNPYQLEFKNNSFALYSTGPDSFLATDDIYLPPSM